MFRKSFVVVASGLMLALMMALFTACGQPAAPAAPAAPGPAAPGQPAPPPPPPAAPAPAPAVVADIGDDAILGAVAAELGITEFNESPWFQGRGYPSINERLPRNPAVWATASESLMRFQEGRFSGYPLRTIRMEPIWDALIWTGNEEPLITSPDRLGAEFVPNIVESYDISADLTTFTFTLREGMRWSDGHPVTTEDVYFAWHYFILDPRIHPTTGTWQRAGGDPRGEIAELIIVDRYTFRVQYAGPTGGVIAWIAFSNYHNWLHPAHHMAHLHIDHADEAELRVLVENHGLLFPEEWHTFYQYHRPDPWNTGRTAHIYPHGRVGQGTPSISAWVHYRDGDTRIFHRNPYFWKIDRYGNQLPYIDEIHSHLVVDLAAATIRILAGDVDHAYEWVPLAQVPLFAENAAAGGYRLLTNTILHRTDADLMFGMTYECERWRGVVQDIRFRQAVSRAINREEILEAVYLGFARVSDIQNPRHDMDEARALLADMGLAPAGDGFLSPDGQPFVIDFSYSAHMAQFGPTAQIINEVLRELGFNINFRQIDSPLVNTRREANDVQLGIQFLHGPVKPMFDDWQWNGSWRLWQQYWTTAGEVGEPMPDWVREFYEVVFRGVRQNHPRYIPAARQRMRELQAEHYLHIIPVEDVVQVTLINNDLRNVPEAGFFMVGCWGMDAWWFDR